MASFDAARSVRFDLARGHVELSDGEPQVLIPLSALSTLLAGACDGRALGRAVGVGAMGRVAMRLLPKGSAGYDAREAVRRASLETVVDVLGGELAILGLGSLRIERWGDALLFVLDPHELDERSDDFVCGIFEGALSSTSDRDVSALVIDRSGTSLRVLAANPRAVAHAARLLKVGSFFTEIVSMLHDSSLAIEEPSK